MSIAFHQQVRLAQPLAHTSLHWRLVVLAAWLCLAPSMPGTMLKDWYAYVIVAGVSLLMVSSVNWADRLLQTWIEPANLGLLLGIVATWLSVATTPLTLSTGDRFQLAREVYPLILVGALPSLTSAISAGDGDRFFERFTWLFLLGCLFGFALQTVSPQFFEIMLRYYYTESSEEARGFMQNRPGLTFGNPNVIGLAIAFAGITAATARSASTWKIIGAIGLSACLILWTASRTALFAFAAAVALLGVFQATRLVASIVALCGALLFSSLFIDFSGLTEWVNDMAYRFIYEHSSLTERQEIWMNLLSNTEWRFYSYFGLGPDKKNILIFDSGYVLVMYRYGLFGFSCMVWWQLCLLIGGVYDFWRSDQWHRGLRRAALAVCFLCASYAMAPMSDPRLGGLFIWLVVSTSIMRHSTAPRQLSPMRRNAVPPFAVSRGVRPCAS